MFLTSWLQALRTARQSRQRLGGFGGSRAARPLSGESGYPAECLETRALLSVSVLLIDGQLDIAASGADNVSVRANSSGLVEVHDQNGLLTSVPSVSASAIQALTITGSDSANVIDLSGVTAAQFSARPSLQVSGGDGDDRITGSPDLDNSLNGGDGADTLIGQAGNDTLNGGNGADSILGGLGNDSLLGGDGADTITGDDGNDTILAGNGSDTVDAGNGNDSVEGNNGEDSLLGGAGADTLNGNGGTDTISGGDGNDSILGGEFNDSLLGGAGNDTIDAQAGNDTVDGGADDDSLLGGNGRDSLSGNVGNDTLNGQADDDTVSGDDGNDLLLGGAGNDSMEGGTGNDTGLGQAGHDTLIGSSGADSLDGGTGNDLIRSEQVPVITPPTLSIDNVTLTEGGNRITVFSSDFNSGVPAGFSGVTTLVPVQGYAGLGTGTNVFSGNLLHNNTGASVAIPNSVPQTPTTLTLTGLPAHSSIDIEFLLAIINSFNGISTSAVFANDFFNVRVDGNVVFRPSFDNNATPGTVQSYNPPPGVNVSPSPLTDLGFGPEFNRVDSAWNVGLDPVLHNIPHFASTLTIDFFADGTGFEGGDNESWGIDNLQVILNGTTTATFTVSLSQPSATPVTVDYTTNDGTAITGSDYGSTASTLMFVPGITQQTISVPVFDDATDETTEDFLVNLSNPTNAVLFDAQAVGTILDNDAPQPQLFGIGTQDSPGELFRVNPLTAVTTTVGTINVLNMIGITADPSGNIYTLNSGSNRLSQIDPYTGLATQIATLNPATNFQEGDLAFDVSNNSIVTVSTGGPPVLSRVNVATGAVTTIGNLQVSAGTNIAGTVEVDGLAFRGPGLYAIITAGATGNDAALNDNLVLINPQTGVLTNVGDLGFDFGARAGLAYDRINDVFYAADGVSGTLYRVNALTGAATVIGPLGRGNVTGLALADVPAAPALAASISDATLNPEGNSGQATLDFTVFLAAQPTSNVTVNFATLDGSATAGLDYLATSNSVTFTPTGPLTQTISVTVLGDQLEELNESFFVRLTGISGSGAILNRTQALGSIIDDDDDSQNDTLLGGDGNDTLIAADGDDLLNGGAGNDSLDGSTGNDSLFGGAEADTLSGGDGDDTLDGQGGTDVVEGSAGDDSLVWNGAGGGKDTLSNSSGDDTVMVIGTGASNLFVLGQDALGRLTVTEGGGQLVVEKSVLNVIVNGGNGDDNITVGSLTNVVGTVLTINGEAGNDTLSAAGVSIGLVRMRLSGDAGNDSLTGSTAGDTLDGGAGDDVVLGGLGNDTLLGGAGIDRLNGEAGDDSLDGGDDNDVLRGLDGNDSIGGGNGDDSVLAGNGNDTVSGDAGADTLNGEAGNDSLSGGIGTDTLSGGDGADTLDGGTESDSLTGNAGDDLLRGGDGHDSIDAGDGNDTVIGGDGDDNLLGGNGNDAISGGDGNDILNGGAGNDSLLGGDGRDTLRGGSSNDVLLGGDGDDNLDGQGGTDIIAGNEGVDTLNNTLGDIINETFALSAALLTALEA